MAAGRRGRWRVPRQAQDGILTSSAAPDDAAWFEQNAAVLEKAYLAGANPRQQCGFGREPADWERFRRPVTAAVQKSGTFLDIGCASGLLMEDVARWAEEDGHAVEPYGLDISAKLAELARERLPRWRDRIFIGNALYWDPPRRFDYVRTELVYVPRHRRRELAHRLLDRFVAPGGSAIFCSYGSARPEGIRTEDIAAELESYGLTICGTHEVVSPAHGFVITSVVWTGAP